METVREKLMKLYAVRDKATGKLVSNITNPRRKYWDREGNCKNAVSTAKRRVSNRGRDLEMVEFTLVENYDERQITSASQEWVSVDERLPDIGGMPVLMVAVNTFGQQAIVKGFTDYFSSSGFLTNEKEYEHIWDAWKVTHWMPLPEPPKEVQ